MKTEISDAMVESINTNNDIDSLRVTALALLEAVMELDAGCDGLSDVARRLVEEKKELLDLLSDPNAVARLGATLLTS